MQTRTNAFWEGEVMLDNVHHRINGRWRKLWPLRVHDLGIRGTNARFSSRASKVDGLGCPSHLARGIVWHIHNEPFVLQLRLAGHDFCTMQLNGRTKKHSIQLGQLHHVLAEAFLAALWRRLCLGEGPSSEVLCTIQWWNLRQLDVQCLHVIKQFLQSAGRLSLTLSQEVGDENGVQSDDQLFVALD
eukprot:Skav230382  [mRNA]  locus=scaffold62:123397:129998:- [translate_table: standard]